MDIDLTRIDEKDHEVKFMLSELDYKKLRRVVSHKGNQGVAGYVRTHLLPHIRRDWDAFCEQLERDVRAVEALRCARHGTDESRRA